MADTILRTTMPLTERHKMWIAQEYGRNMQNVCTCGWGGVRYAIGKDTRLDCTEMQLERILHFVEQIAATITVEVEHVIRPKEVSNGV